MPARDAQILRQLRVTNPVRTLFDLAGVVDAETLEVILDFVLFRGFASVESLLRRQAALAGRGVRGSALLRKLLRDRGSDEAVPQSVLETRFIQLLGKRNLPLPCKQVTMKSHEASYRVDFYFPHSRLVVEVDGGRWHVGREAMQRDRRRDNFLTVQGARVLRLTWHDVMRDQDYVERQLRAGLGLTPLH